MASYSKAWRIGEAGLAGVSSQSGGSSYGAGWCVSVVGGLGVPELRRLRQLEEENRKLKQLVADLSLDKVMLQGVLSKKL
jgi:hypothetical protein